MKVIIMGCGRLGKMVSEVLADEGHEVSVIDSDANALARLGPDFKGRKVRGIGFDKDVLIEAGIAEADAFAATSSSDNANIIAARIARNIFSVPRVVARLFDPYRAEVYQRLGMVTISSTAWGAERIRQLLIFSDLDPQFTFGNGEVTLVDVDTPAQLIGRRVRDLTVNGEINVVAITRRGHAFIPMLGTEFQSDDTIHLSVLSSAMDRLNALIGLGEGG